MGGTAQRKLKTKLNLKGYFTHLRQFSLRLREGTYAYSIENKNTAESGDFGVCCDDGGDDSECFNNKVDIL
jgi:hypothetical protein